MANPVKSGNNGSGWLIGFAAVVSVVVGIGIYGMSGSMSGPAPDALMAVKPAAESVAASTTAASIASTAATTAPAATTAAAATEATMEAPVAEFPVADLLVPGPLPEIVIGQASAPITIVEYASTTCPHCAEFHKTVLPGLKSKYIDTGKVRLVYREFARDNLDAAVYMLARCLEPSKYMTFIGVMFEKQEVWAFADGDPLPRLLDFAKQAGFTDETFKTCLSDQKLLENLMSVRTRAVDSFKVNSTPSVFVNGVRFQGNTLPELEQLLAKLGAN